MLKDDDSGQFILLMSVVVAIGLVILLVFFNQSLMAGYSSSQSIMDFPKNDIRDFRSETVSEAYILGNNINGNLLGNNDQNAFNNSFNDNFTRYRDQIQDLSMEHGTVVNVTWQNAVGGQNYKCENITLNLYYNNGETSYGENTVVYLT